MSQSKKRGLFASGLAAVIPAIALGATGTQLAGSKVDNFMLADQTGMGHELYYYTGSAAVVIVSSAEGDPVSAKAAAALAKVRDDFKGRNVEFMMLDSSLASNHFSPNVDAHEILAALAPEAPPNWREDGTHVALQPILAAIQSAARFRPLRENSCSG